MDLLVITREFPPHVVGGLSYHLGNLYGELSERGHDVTVVTGVARDAERAAEALVPDEVTVHEVGFGRFRNQHLKFPIALRRFLRGFDVERFDVACTHTQIPYGLPIPTVCKYTDCAQVERQYFRQELDSLGRVADTLVNPTRRVVDNLSLRYVDHVIFNSDLCRNAWKEEYGIPTPSTTIHNGVDSAVFAPQEGGPTEEYVLFVGDSVRKGLPTVRDYAAEASLSVYVVGDVAESEGLTVVGRVSQDRLAELYSSAVATVHPARFEAFGNIVLESLACGTPVVTTSRCGASEILTPACGAVDVPLADGVTKCRELSGDRCRSLALEHTWSATGEATETVLQTVR